MTGVLAGHRGGPDCILGQSTWDFGEKIGSGTGLCPYPLSVSLHECSIQYYLVINKRTNGKILKTFRELRCSIGSVGLWGRKSSYITCFLWVWRALRLMGISVNAVR